MRVLPIGDEAASEKRRNPAKVKKNPLLPLAARVLKDYRFASASILTKAWQGIENPPEPLMVTGCRF